MRLAFRTSRLAALLVVASVGIRPGESLAAPPAAPQARAPEPAGVALNPQEAKVHLADGLKFLKQKLYEAARDEFALAYRLGHQAVALRLLAECQRELRNFADAHESYQRVLTDHPGEINAQEKADIELQSSAMLLLTGTAKIEFDERGAEVFVDGKSVGKTPMIPPIILNPGTHDFWILKEGFETVEKRGVTIKSQEVTIVSLKFIPDKNDKSANSLGGTKPSAKRGNDDEDDDTPRKKKKRRRDRDDEDEDDSREESTPASTTGAYVDITGFGSFVLSKYPLLPCPDPPYASCTSSRAFGGGAVLRGGYRFGVLSLEAVGAFLADRHEEKHAIQGTLNPADAEFAEGLLSRYEGYSLYSLGGFVGAGGRLTSSGNFRLTFGLSPGITFRNFSLVRYTSGGVTDEYGADASYASFAGLVDAGMIIGISKSAAIGVGVLFWVDAPRGDAVTPSGDPRPVSVKTTEGNVDATIPTPRYVLASGLQMFVGLGISAHFGP